MIGSEGGVLSFESERGSVRIEIPPGALERATDIQIQSHDGPFLKGSLGAVWDLGPSGTAFLKPVKLTLRYTDSDVASRVMPRLRIGSISDGDITLLDPAASEIGEVSAWTEHFSLFGLVEDPEVVSTLSNLRGKQFTAGSLTLRSDVDVHLRSMVVTPSYASRYSVYVHCDRRDDDHCGYRLQSANDQRGIFGVYLKSRRNKFTP